MTLPRWWDLLQAASADLGISSSVSAVWGPGAIASVLARQLQVLRVTKSHNEHQRSHGGALLPLSLSASTDLATDSCHLDWQTVPTQSGSPLLLAGNNRDAIFQALYEFAQAKESSGCWLVGANAVGIATTLKRLRDQGVHYYDAGSRDKHRAAYVQNIPDFTAPPWPSYQWSTEDWSPLTVHNAPAAFAAGRLDKGTEFLWQTVRAENIAAPELVCDLAAGCGPLALAAARYWPQAQVDAYEDDRDALCALVKNTDVWQVANRLRGYWWSAGTPVQRRDAALVLCNPPFHQGQRGTEFRIAEQLITDAWDALRPGGRAYIVANRQLPYEKHCAQLAEQWQIVAENAQFKIICLYRS